MDKLRTPMLIAAVVTILFGIAAFFPSLASRVFGYEIKDPGAGLFLSAALIGFGIVMWAIGQETAKYGGLASSVAVAIGIGVLFTLYGWVRTYYTARSAVIPLVIGVILVVWIWSARPKS